MINDDLLKITPDLGTESAQIVIADPPYNIGKDFGNKSDKQPMGEYLKWCDDWIKECLRILRCLLYTSPSPRDVLRSRMPSSA